MLDICFSTFVCESFLLSSSSIAIYVLVLSVLLICCAYFVTYVYYWYVVHIELCLLLICNAYFVIFIICLDGLKRFLITNLKLNVLGSFLQHPFTPG
jgi:hypothetical protein